ncbi:MAG: DUF362 domain-containing protein, partial [Candidatus Altiarchaeota archaeon]|nr:DUF362 domain-containing protein [Candidatus Altiarchaeota archaeon]
MDYKIKALKTLGKRLQKSIFFATLASLFWLLYRTGTKPSRITYPCQQAAAFQVSTTLYLIPFLYVHRIRHFLKYKFDFQLLAKYTFVTLFIFGIVVVGSNIYDGWEAAREAAIEKEHASIGPIGKIIAGSSGAVFATIPHAMALPSPHRVVSVQDRDATSWDFSCTSTGACPTYYGDEEYIDQNIVYQMFDKGIMELTGAATPEAAWRMILPDYIPGKKIAIKVNFNDAVVGGGTAGYGDNDAYVDALPQPINGVVRGLKSIGVREEDIQVFDTSRYITDRFRAGIKYPGIEYFDRYGNGADVQPGGFSSTDPSAFVDFSDSGYPTARRLTDVLVNADYVINMPIMKGHGNALITLSFKNHFGSLDGGPYGLSQGMHDYFYPGGAYFSTTKNPLVDISNNPNIRDKTILIVGDALYGARDGNNEPPKRWRVFGEDSPNMLLFSVDPVAIDSVMYDYLEWECIYSKVNGQWVLHVAADKGLGVHEHWNNDNDRDYSQIDYVEIDLDSETCTSNAACDDLNLCTYDLCKDSSCVNNNANLD